jgi:thermostable 8-oxoguanine DNA glycosylase
MSVRDLVVSECTTAGLRRAPTIAANLDRIFSGLEAGEWKTLRAQLESLSTNTSQRKERAVVAYLLHGKKYPGLGQKQARNLIQWLGLSRYEIPLDSRVLKKLREFGSNFVPSGTALTDEAVYLYVQEGLQSIAKHLDIYPCELDACIFASFDISDDAEGDDEV